MNFRFMRRILVLVLSLACVLGMTGPFAPMTVRADVQTMTYRIVQEGEQSDTVQVGSMGTLIPSVTKEHAGCTFTYSSSDDTRLFVSINGIYVALSQGDTFITVTGKDAAGTIRFEAKVNLAIVNNVTLGAETGTESPAVTYTGEAGVTTGPVYSLSGLTLSAGGILMAPGDVNILSVKNTSREITWESSDPSVATVGADGTVTAISEGNCLITASAGGAKSACAIAVTSQVKKNAINYAKAYAASATYSQARRMQDGYYDCSSLVYKAYSKYGVQLCGYNYAQTSAAYGQWFEEHDQAVEGGLSTENVHNMVLRAGDLYCQSGEYNGRYKNIYHIEMFAGYVFKGYRTDGSPILGTLWANAKQDAYTLDGGIIGRP